jgi:hypothetical protein
MAFRPGDYVYPADLPRRLLCRVTAVDTERTATGAFQILTLEPLDALWKGSGTAELVRLDEHVRPAPAGAGWRSVGPGAAAS